MKILFVYTLQLKSVGIANGFPLSAIVTCGYDILSSTYRLVWFLGSLNKIINRNIVNINRGIIPHII